MPQEEQTKQYIVTSCCHSSFPEENKAMACASAATESLLLLSLLAVNWKNKIDRSRRFRARGNGWGRPGVGVEALKHASRYSSSGACIWTGQVGRIVFGGSNMSAHPPGRSRKNYSDQLDLSRLILSCRPLV
jgi:hypothetical protein